MTATGNATPKSQSAILLAVCIFVLFVGEAYWLYNWHRSNEELALANVRRAGQNTIDKRKILELRSATVRIDGLISVCWIPLLPPRKLFSSPLP